MQTLVLADHQVYVGIRDPKLEHTKFRECVENYIIRKLLKFGDAAIQGVADKIAEILAIPKGMRPLRDTVDYSDWLAEPRTQQEKPYRKSCQNCGLSRYQTVISHLFIRGIYYEPEYFCHLNKNNTWTSNYNIHNS